MRKSVGSIKAKMKDTQRFAEEKAEEYASKRANKTTEYARYSELYNAHYAGVIYWTAELIHLREALKVQGKEIKKEIKLADTVPATVEAIEDLI